MGQMRDADWSRETLLRSDWLGPKVAPYTTYDLVQYNIRDPPYSVVCVQ